MSEGEYGVGVCVERVVVGDRSRCLLSFGTEDEFCASLEERDSELMLREGLLFVVF